MQRTDFGTSAVQLHIHFDYADDQSETLVVASSFRFKHGVKQIRRSAIRLGFAESWFSIPTPRQGNFIILEDDIELSPMWYSWLTRAWNTYDTREDFAGISLQRQTLIPYEPYT